MSDADTVIWRPSGRVFLKRAALAAFLFILIGSPIGTLSLFGTVLQLDLIGMVLGISTTIVSVIFLMIVFDDWQNWNLHRHDEWRLSNWSLGYRNLDESMEFADLPLVEVKSVSKRFWRGIKIKTREGRAFQMSYLPNPKEVKELLTMRIQSAQGGQPS